MELISAVSLLLAISNLLLYIFWLILGSNIFVSFLAICLALIFITIYYRKFPFQIKNKPLIKLGSIPSLLLIIFNLILIGFVLSPYIKLTNVNNFISVGYSSVTDLFKHSYVVTSLKTFGLPLQHPYFPPAAFSYYYGYYLIPALFSKLWPQFQNYFVYFYILLTDFLSIFVLYSIINKIIKNNFLRFSALSLVIIGMGMDIFPMFIGGELNHPNLIEMWSISNHLGLRVDNTYVSLLWTPQHFFAAALSLLFIYKIIQKKSTLWFLIPVFSFVCLSSAFVALALALAILLIFLLIPHKKREIISIGIISVILLFPYFISVFGKGVSIFQFYHFLPYHFIEGKQFLNYLLTLLSEYGLIFFLLPLLIPIYIKRIGIRYTLGLFLCVYVPIVITWFVRSSGYNDFALRGIVLSQLLAIILFVASIEMTSRRLVKYILIGIIYLNLIISCSGFVFEYISRWKTRQILDPYASELILKLRSLDDSQLFAAAGKDEWIYKIPPLAFKPIYTSNLYDSGGYLQDDPQKTFGKYEAQEKDIYFSPNIGKNITEIISQRNHYLSTINHFLSNYQYDWIIFDNRMGVKTGLNFWVAFFEKIGVNSWKLTNTFTAFNRQNLIQQLATQKIIIDQAQKQIYKITDNKISLPSGFWYLVMCNEQKNNTILSFEPENTYSIFSSSISGGSCIGNFIYLKNNSLYKLIDSHNQQVNIYPVTLKNNL